MTMPRIFVSHSSEDAAFANRLSNDLRSHGADVWLDSSHIASGDFIARINQALQQRDVVILVLSPAAIRSNWVTQEFNAAIARSHQGFMQAPLVIMAQPCPLADIPPMWTVYHRYDATQNYPNALNGLLQGLLSSGSAQSIPAIATAVSSAQTPPPNAVIYVDALRSNTNGWDIGNHRSFKSDGLHIQNLKDLSNSKAQPLIAWAPRNRFGDNLGNMTLTVNARLCHNGESRGLGIYFRSQDDILRYCFAVTSTGKWLFYRCQGLKPNDLVYVVPWTENQNIRKGLNVSNALRVSAFGSHFDFYINNEKVGDAEDSTYLSGKVGLGAGHDVEVVFTDLVITAW